MFTLHHSLLLGWGPWLGSLVSPGCCCRGHCHSAASGQWQFVCCDRRCHPVTICLLWQELQSLDVCGAESVCLPLQEWGCIHHPLSLWNNTQLPSILEFLNKFPPPTLPLPWEGPELPVNTCRPSLLPLHCPLWCLLMNPRCWALPVPLTWAGAAPSEVPPMLPPVPLVCLAFPLWNIILYFILVSLFIFSCLQSWCVICNF